MKNFVYSATSWFAGSRFGAKLFSMSAHTLDKGLLKLTKGKTSATKILSGKQIFVLTSTGARTGLRRETVINGVMDGENVLIIAANWGKEALPNWYYNLKAYPAAILSFQGTNRNYVARVASGNERERAWNAVVKIHPPYLEFSKRLTKRKLPVLIMEPG